MSRALGARQRVISPTRFPAGVRRRRGRNRSASLSGNPIMISAEELFGNLSSWAKNQSDISEEQY